jgi:hypothetical protein
LWTFVIASNNTACKKEGKIKNPNDFGRGSYKPLHEGTPFDRKKDEYNLTYRNLFFKYGHHQDEIETISFCNASFPNESEPLSKIAITMSEALHHWVCRPKWRV